MLLVELGSDQDQRQRPDRTRQQQQTEQAQANTARFDCRRNTRVWPIDAEILVAGRGQLLPQG